MCTIERGIYTVWFEGHCVIGKKKDGNIEKSGLRFLGDELDMEQKQLRNVNEDF